MHHPVLDIAELSVEFPVFDGSVRALDGISLEVGAGEVVGLVGESGCGKSVTSLLAMRLLPEQAYRVVGGRLTLLGRDMLAAPEGELVGLRGREAAMIFQEPLTALNPTKRIGRQMVEVLQHNHPGIGRAEATALAVRLLGEMRIPDPAETLKRYPFELSGGMRQRVLIAMAFSGDPAIVIADEPTTALDVTVQKQILVLLRARAKQSHTAVLLITHDMGLVSQFTDRLYVMYAGRIVEAGLTADILGSPAHPYTQALLAALPEQVVPKAVLPAIPGQVPDLRHPPAGCGFAERCSQRHGRCGMRPPLSPAAGPTGRPDGHRAACWLTRLAEAAS